MPQRQPEKHEFQQRLLGGFGRSGIQREALRMKGSAFRKRYGALVLGATIAMGGVATHNLANQDAQASATQPEAPDDGVVNGITRDLVAAQNIAMEVASGVSAAASDVTSAAAPLRVAEAAREDLTLVTEKAREAFFKSEIPFGGIIYKEAKINNIDPELLAAVVKTESQFRPTARSHAGAQGLMQLVPKTGRWMGAKNLMNPAENVRAGAKYLKYLNGRFDGDRDKVLAAYNAGEGNVRRFGGVPPFKETRKYVSKVRNSERDFRDQVSGHVADLVQPVESGR